MRILFLVNRYPGVGGIENMTTLLAKLFKTELGHETSIFSVSAQDGIQVDSSLFDYSISVKVAKSADQSQIFSEFKSFVDIKKPDLIIFQDSYASIEYLLYNLKDNVKYSHVKIFTVEHNTPDCLLKGYIQHWKKHKFASRRGFFRKLVFPYVYSKILKANKLRHRSLVQLSDRYILLSESYKSILKSLFGISSNNIIAIANIKNDFPGIQRSNALLEKEKKLLFVGRLNAQKGIDKLVEVWKRLQLKLPDYELLVVGDGEERTYLEGAIQKYNLKRIHLEGFKSNISNYYEKSSAILMTSIFEGLPLVLAEAMQFGVVPFAFDTFSSLHDVVDNNKSGYIVRPFNLNAYVNTICSFIKMDKDNQLQIRQQAILKSEDFSKIKILNDWKELFESAL